MYFYHVWVRSLRYRGHDPLTYSFGQKLPVGTLVRVPLQKDHVLGVVVALTDKPAFAVKNIETAYDFLPLPTELLTVASWMQQFYASPIGVIAQQLLPANITNIRKQPAPKAPKHAVTLFQLTIEQEDALKHITSPNTYILHGKTGTGKTRIYIELTKKALQKGKAALILSPEIGLTSQLSRNFIGQFGEKVILLHSRLTPKERQEAWLKVLNTTTPLVVIGPRSALFSPLKNIGLLVVDESHEPAYKQEQAPYYHATRIAARLAREHGSILILGSATPLVTDYFMAEQLGKPILRLTQAATSTHETSLTQTIVDIKDRSLFSRGSYLSDTLIEAIEDTLKRGEQTLLYLNRRGTARLVVCENCGWQAVCPHCDLPLAYHGDSHSLRCHVCGYQQVPPTNCPSCGQPKITFRSIGTKAIVDEIKRLLPSAVTQRFDTDNKKSERLEQHFDTIHAGKVDILVGTQVLAKGLDLPHLATVGVVAADSSLAIPDFTAAERTYQLLTQVLGRIGRGHRDGHAIIQTYVPDSPLLHAAINDDWDSFYRGELIERRKFLFPPFCHLLQLTCRRASARSAEQAAQKFIAELHLKMPNLIIEGPAPSFHEKVQGKYQWQVVVKSTNHTDLILVIGLLPTSGWSYNIDPVNLL